MLIDTFVSFEKSCPLHTHIVIVMTNVEKYFGVAVMPEPKCPPLNIEAIEEEVRRSIEILNDYNPEEYRLYLYTLTFNFSDFTKDRLNQLMCRLRVPNKAYQDDKIHFLNHLVPVPEPYYYQERESNKYVSQKTHNIKIHTSMKRITYNFNNEIIDQIRSFVHRLIIYVKQDISDKERFIKAAIAGVPDLSYRTELMKSSDLPESIKTQLQQTGGVSSNFNVQLMHLSQIHTFESGGDKGTPDVELAISYASEDQSDALVFQEKLEDKDVKTWIDIKDLKPGEVVLETLANVFSGARGVCVLLGSSGIGSWQRAEVRMALQHAISNDVPVIPVFLPDAPQDAKVPPYLEQYSWVDFRKGFREEGIRKIVSKLKNEPV